MGYQYTYATDNAHLDDLPEHLRLVATRMQDGGGDLAEALRNDTTLTGYEKAELAIAWGGPGAGQEFVR